MRSRPVRPNIFLPVVRFGVADSDWFTVLLISCVGYLLPVPFGITLLYVPLQMWTWLLATAGSIAFFNYIRIGRKPRWLEHKVKSLFLHHRHCRAIPNGKRRSWQRPWIIDAAESQVAKHLEKQSATGLLLHQNHEVLEAYEHRWNQDLLTTN